MPSKRSPMRKITEVLRLKFEAKLSHDKIARAAGVSKGAVNKYVSLAKAQGLSWPLPPDMDEAALEARLYPPREASTRYAEPDHAKLHTELKRKGVTLQLLWSEYVAEVGDRAYRYSQFCERYRQWAKRQKRSMRQVHRAGEKLFIDYCGPTVPVVDPQTGEFRSAQVFVAVLGASSYTYAEATWSQSLPDWIASHQRAFAFFSGVPQLLVPDNLIITAPPSSRHALTSLKTRPRRRSPFRWSNAGYWPVCAITPSSRCQRSTGSLPNCSRISTSGPFKNSRARVAPCSTTRIDPPSSPCHNNPTSMPSGCRPSRVSTTTSRRTNASTASRMSWSAKSWMSVCAPPPWKSSTSASASLCTRGVVPIASPPLMSTCPRPTARTANGHRDGS